MVPENSSVDLVNVVFILGFRKKLPPSYFTTFFYGKIVVKFSPLRGEKSSDLEFSGFFYFSSLKFQVFSKTFFLKYYLS